MCKSKVDGGHRCRCKTAKAAAAKRDAAAKRQARYMKKKRAATVNVDIEQSPEPEQAEHAAPDPENPFTDFTPEVVTLTDEQRAEQKARLDDFFERKLADPTAQWHAAPKPEPDEVEAGFREFMAELRGVTST